MKHSKISTILLISAAALTGFTMAGCNSMDHRNSASVTAASDTEVGYIKLNTVLTSAIARLEALKDTSGSPDAYLTTIKSVQSSVHDEADNVATARVDLKASGDKQVARMQEESAKITNPDLSKDFVARSEKLRGYYNDYDKASASLGDYLAKGDTALNDAKVAVGANPSDAVIKMSQDSVSKAISAFKDAKGAIPDARKALTTLREHQPVIVQ